MRFSIKVSALLFLVLMLPTFASAAKTHRVKKNESLQSLARKYNVSVVALKSVNNLVSQQVKRGDTLVIPPRVAGSGKKAKAGMSTYKVNKGDNLSTIAKKTGTSVQDLNRLNSLSKNKLKVGQVLVLKEPEPENEPHLRVARKAELRYANLFNEKDYEQSLAELSEPDINKPVQLNNMELGADTTKMLRTTAYGFLGTRYRFGGSSKNGIDCSSFVQQVFRELEVALPRTAREQFEVGNQVTPGDLQKGDLIFFRTYASYPSHVGIYLGNNRMIHASSRDRRVVISPMNTSYYRARYIGAKRISEVNPETFRFDDLFSGVAEESLEESLTSDALGLTMAN